MARVSSRTSHHSIALRQIRCRRYSRDSPRRNTAIELRIFLTTVPGESEQEERRPAKGSPWTSRWKPIFATIGPGLVGWRDPTIRTRNQPAKCGLICSPFNLYSWTLETTSPQSIERSGVCSIEGNAVLSPGVSVLGDCPGAATD